MRCWLLVMVVTISWASPARAQDPPALAGVVVDATSGLGIAGALVAADDATAESGPDGYFALAGVQPPRGRRVAVFVFAAGYAPAEAHLTARVPGRIALHRDAAAVEIIEVSGKAPDGASPTAYNFNRDQIRALPGTGNDVLRALQSMPGVSRMAYGIGGLVLRGASPHESTVYLDGIEVPLAYHFGGVTSFYPSTLLDEVALSPGGADVIFGRGVGGVAELRSRTARTDRLRIGSEIGIFDASVYGEAPAAGGGVAIGLRRSYADAFIGKLLPEDRLVLPRYYDGQVRWDRALAGGTVSVLGFFSDDRIVAWGGTDFRQGFTRGAVRWQRDVGRTSLSLMPWGGLGRTELKYVLEHTPNRPDLAQKVRLDRHPLGLRAELRRTTDWGHLAAGVDVQGASVRFEQSLNVLMGSPHRVISNGAYLDGGLWLEGRWRIEDGKLTIKPGVRLDYLGVADAFVIEPRIATTHELAPWLTLRETFGFHHQPPGPVTAADVPRDVPNILTFSDPTGQVVQGVHTSVGARVELPRSVISSLTLYHVLRRGSPDPEAVDDGSNTSGAELFDLPFETGLGIMLDNAISEEFEGVRHDSRRGFGAELSVQRRTDRWLMWLSYTLATAQSRPSGPTRRTWTTMQLDQTHNLNAVASVTLGAWRLGARFRYTTGLPYTPRVSAVVIDADDGEELVEYGERNSARLASFVSVDLRVDRTWKRPWGALGFFFDLQNVTNELNPEAVNYALGSVEPWFQGGLPTMPMLGLSYQPPD